MASDHAAKRHEQARAFLRAGRRDWALTVVGELLQSPAGREYALCLLAEMYPEDTVSAVPVDIALLPERPESRNIPARKPA